MNLENKITTLKGIGEKSNALFEKLGVKNIGDLLNYFPRQYERFEEPTPIDELAVGGVYTIMGMVKARPQTSSNRNLPVTSAFLKDETGEVKVIWYRMPFLRNTMPINLPVIFRGRMTLKQNKLVMEHPEMYSLPKYEEKRHSLQPIYPLTSGLTNNMVQKAIKQVFSANLNLAEYLNPDILDEYQLYSYHDAIKAIHFPTHDEDYIHGRRRLVFDEFLFFLLSIRSLKEENQKEKNTFSFTSQDAVDKIIEKLPYELTDAQKKVWEEIKNDFLGEHLMNRLVQGDVGSGKTIVAVLALVFVVSNGYQGAFMAPTEILARQHYENLVKIFSEFKLEINVQLLTGSMTAKEKREAYEKIEGGQAQIIVGTNALIQEKVNYHKLALVITDEQHRFGVKQRETFIKKGSIPHVLVMSATPIPRTLAVILYGDLDISVIDELPKNRLPIKNAVVDLNYRKTAYNFITKEVSKGHQCYIICPMVEESEKLEVENVIDYTQSIRGALDSSIEVTYLHGKMKQEEKDHIMERFSKNEIQVLVSTTVIEVGIDVPNATVILIENAERFGLAQLHQLRGRVGRSDIQSYCILMSPSKNKETKERLEILKGSNDGFFIASEDLRLRGPGDIFGIRQSGILGFTLGDVYQDGNILKEVSQLADSLVREDPKLEKEENLALARELRKYQGRHLAMLTL